MNEFERPRSAFAALERRRTGVSRVDDRRCRDCGRLFGNGAGSFGGG